MKKLVWVFLIVSGAVSAQDLDSLQMDTLSKASPAYLFGIYASARLARAPSTPSPNAITSYGMGIQYNKWMLSVNVYDYSGSFQTYLIFPNVFELDYRYAGAEIAFEVDDTKWIGYMLFISYQKGEMSWKNIAIQENFLSDKFDLWKGGVRLEMNKFRYIRPQVALGYQKIGQLNLAGVEADDFSGFFVAVGVRIGYFNQ